MTKQETICGKHKIKRCLSCGNLDLTNLQKITHPWKFGWSATINFNENAADVIGIMNESIQVRVLEDSAIEWIPLFNIPNFPIIGYKYAGELAGNEPIPEGQKFRNKGNNEIREHVTDSASAVCLRLYDAVTGDKEAYFPKCEIEPYFE